MKDDCIDFSGFDEVEADMQYLESQMVEYGFLDNDPHPSNPDISIPTVAMYNNEGVKDKSGGTWRIPPRPFMDLSAILVGTRLDDFSDQVMWGVTKRKSGIRTALDFVAKESADTVREAISDGDFAVNAPSTIASKGSDTILVDSSTMYDAARGDVVDYRSGDDM